jgi:hypothetical protein
MVPTNKPQNKLNGIEYLLLSIQSNPGKSQRWHLRRKHMYQHGRPDYHKGGSGCGYFRSSSYRNVLWTDCAPKDVQYECWVPVDDGYRSKSAQMHLTRQGWTRANEVRAKLGLPYKGRPPRLDYSAM